jgi:hypothetical protein
VTLSQTNSLVAIPSFRSSVAVRSACDRLCCLSLWAVRAVRREGAIRARPSYAFTAYRPKYVELGKAERMGCPQFLTLGGA